MLMWKHSTVSIYTDNAFICIQHPYGTYHLVCPHICKYKKICILIALFLTLMLITEMKTITYYRKLVQFLLQTFCIQFYLWICRFSWKSHTPCSCNRLCTVSFSGWKQCVNNEFMRNTLWSLPLLFWLVFVDSLMSY